MYLLIQFAGWNISEPMTLLTNTLICATGIYHSNKVYNGHRGQIDYIYNFCFFLFFTAISAIWGGIFSHGFKEYFSIAYSIPGWILALLGSFFAVRGALQHAYHQLCLMPPPSSGGVLIAQMLKVMERMNLSEKGHNTAPYIHGLVEITRRAYADRSEYFGDPDYVVNHINTLLSNKYINEKYDNINPHKATPSKDIKAGEVERIESFETTHFSIVDQWQNAVAITTTLNGNYGSKMVVAGGGFLLNNEMDDFSVKPGSPNQFGLVGGEANSIQPGKRMLSSMSPTIVSKDGTLYAVVGTPGGSTIITANLQTIANLIDFNMSMKEAVLAPKMHSQWLPDEVYLEKNKFDQSVILQLEKMGHVVKEVNALGKLDCIKVLEDGSLEGGTDPAKGDGTIDGF